MHLSKENVIVKIQGGMGNQLFQYATAKALALRLGVELVLDLNWYIEKNNSHCKFVLDRFNLEDKTFTSSDKLPVIIRKVFYKIAEKLSPLGGTLPVLKDVDFKFNSNLLNLQHPVFLDGYWQNELYFREYRQELINIFDIKSEINIETKQLLETITDSNSICIHIRRGDYITNTKAANINGICSKDYYYQAINILTKNIDSPICYIFSDEPQWAKVNLEFEYQSVFVDINSKDNPELDFLLMRSCKYFIIANSTFSWWAAWLASFKEKKVIAPKTWFLNDILNKNMKLPENWIRI